MAKTFQSWLETKSQKTRNYRTRDPKPQADPLAKIKAESIHQLNGCLYFINDVSPGGYGRVRIGGKRVQASRIVLEDKLGRPLKEDHYPLHTCDNASCVDPNHLYEGTLRDNVKDAIRKGRHIHPNPGTRTGR